jgi:hypothetical protein
MTYPAPIYLGQFDATVAGDVVDRYIDIAADLAVGETIASVVFTVRTAAGVVTPAVISDDTLTATRVDFRITAPAAGAYVLSAAFTVSDGQVLTRTADLWIV